MKHLERITIEPGKCGGRPCIRGLRIRVTDVLGMLAEGVSHEEILRDFPYLEPDDIKAALEYAAAQADHLVIKVGVNFIVDAQLPPALVQFLRSRQHTATHVADLGLAAGDDDPIWDHAKQTGAVIISKDEDFMVRTLVLTDRVPVVWVRFGNCSNRALLTRFAPLLDEIVQRIQSGEQLVEIT